MGVVSVLADTRPIAAQWSPNASRQVYKESYTQSIGNANLLAKDIRDQIHLQQVG